MRIPDNVQKELVPNGSRVIECSLGHIGPLTIETLLKFGLNPNDKFYIYWDDNGEAFIKYTERTLGLVGIGDPSASKDYVIDQIQLDLFKRLGITKYRIDSNDGYAIVDQDVNASNYGDPDILLKLKIKRVMGNFNCSYNLLSSLAGAPSNVEGNFNCSHNLLTSLEGAPRKIGGVLCCNNNAVPFRELYAARMCSASKYLI